MIDVAFLWKVFLTLVAGLPLTLSLAFACVALGAILALLLALMRTSSNLLLRYFAQGYIFVFRGVPLLVLIFLIYYGLSQFRPWLQQAGLWSIFRDAYWCSLLALTVNTAAYAAEVFRGGFNAVPRTHTEAADACGMSRFLKFRRVSLPVAIRQALPAYGNEIILMVKGTSLASTITMMEMTGIANKLMAETFRTGEIFVVAALIYLAINILISRLILALEWWLSPHLRPAPAE